MGAVSVMGSRTPCGPPMVVHLQPSPILLNSLRFCQYRSATGGSGGIEITDRSRGREPESQGFAKGLKLAVQ